MEGTDSSAAGKELDSLQHMGLLKVILYRHASDSSSRAEVLLHLQVRSYQIENQALRQAHQAPGRLREFMAAKNSQLAATQAELARKVRQLSQSDLALNNAKQERSAMASELKDERKARRLLETQIESQASEAKQLKASRCNEAVAHAAAETSKAEAAAYAAENRQLRAKLNAQAEELELCLRQRSEEAKAQAVTAAKNVRLQKSFASRDAAVKSGQAAAQHAATECSKLAMRSADVERELMGTKAALDRLRSAVQGAELWHASADLTQCYDMLGCNKQGSAADQADAGLTAYQQGPTPASKTALMRHDSADADSTSDEEDDVTETGTQNEGAETGRGQADASVSQHQKEPLPRSKEIVSRHGSDTAAASAMEEEAVSQTAVTDWDMQHEARETGGGQSLTLEGQSMDEGNIRGNQAAAGANCGQDTLSPVDEASSLQCTQPDNLPVIQQAEGLQAALGHGLSAPGQSMEVVRTQASAGCTPRQQSPTLSDVLASALAQRHARQQQHDSISLSRSEPPASRHRLVGPSSPPKRHSDSRASGDQIFRGERRYHSKSTHSRSRSPSCSPSTRQRRVTDGSKRHRHTHTHTRRHNRSSNSPRRYYNRSRVGSGQGRPSEQLAGYGRAEDRACPEHGDRNRAGYDQSLEARQPSDQVHHEATRHNTYTAGSGLAWSVGQPVGQERHANTWRSSDMVGSRRDWATGQPIRQRHNSGQNSAARQTIGQGHEQTWSPGQPEGQGHYEDRLAGFEQGNAAGQLVGHGHHTHTTPPFGQDRSGQGLSRHEEQPVKQEKQEHNTGWLNLRDGDTEMQDAGFNAAVPDLTVRGYAPILHTCTDRLSS